MSRRAPPTPACPILVRRGVRRSSRSRSSRPVPAIRPATFASPSSPTRSRWRRFPFDAGGDGREAAIVSPQETDAMLMPSAWAQQATVGGGMLRHCVQGAGAPGSCNLDHRPPCPTRGPRSTHRARDRRGRGSRADASPLPRRLANGGPRVVPGDPRRPARRVRTHLPVRTRDRGARERSAQRLPPVRHPGRVVLAPARDRRGADLDALGLGVGTRGRGVAFHERPPPCVRCTPSSGSRR